MSFYIRCSVRPADKTNLFFLFRPLAFRGPFLLVLFLALIDQRLSFLESSPEVIRLKSLFGFVAGPMNVCSFS